MTKEQYLKEEFPIKKTFTKEELKKMFTQIEEFLKLKPVSWWRSKTADSSIFTWDDFITMLSDNTEIKARYIADTVDNLISLASVN